MGLEVERKSSKVKVAEKSKKSLTSFSTLKDVAKKLKEDDKKVTLLYAFNATGKTRLSMAFKDLVNGVDDNEDDSSEDKEKKIIYFNAFTEDLFYWDNDLDNNIVRVLKVNTNSTFVELIKNQGKEREIVDKFKYYTASKIEPTFDLDNGNISFEISTGDTDSIKDIKISKGEENILIWSIFYVLIETVIDELNLPIADRSTNEFNSIEYIYIDDPISSLDDNHVFEVALDIKELTKKAKEKSLKFVISTHHALFYSILHDYYQNKSISKNTLRKKEDKYELCSQSNNSPFGYHLQVKEEISDAIKNNRVEKWHYALFRNLLEKTATYLGYSHWHDCLVGDSESPIEESNKNLYEKRINNYAHNRHSTLDSKGLQPQEVALLKRLFDNFIAHFNWKEDVDSGN
jgi:wobble nucleotide-excising tRNase